MISAWSSASSLHGQPQPVLQEEFQESQVSQAALKHGIKESPLDVSVEVVFKEKYKEANSALPDTSGATLLKSKAKTNINPRNFIS